MKKNSKNKKKIPAYAFGIDQINTLGSVSKLLGTGIQAASDETSNANIAGSALSGLGTGASAGAMFGPIGAGIGAAVGGIGGLVKGIFNKKAIEEKEKRERTAQATQLGLNNAAAVTQDYYADNGLAYTFENGGILPNKIIKKVNKSSANFVNRLKTPGRKTIPDWETQYNDGIVNPKAYSTHKISTWEGDGGTGLIVPNVQEVDGKLIDFTRPPYNNRAALENALKSGDLVELEKYKDAEWFAKNYKKYYPTFENGGILPNLAYLDNNEIVRDVNGNIAKVPNNKPGTDNHLVNSTTLDSVLSDKIKRPGTNRTFAQEGKRLANMSKESKGKDIFAQNSNKLNKINANKAYEALLAEQEAVKAKKGIKPKKKSIPAYENGEQSDWTRNLSNYLMDFINGIDYSKIQPAAGPAPGRTYTYGSPESYVDAVSYADPKPAGMKEYPRAESARTVQPVKKSTTKTTNTSKPDLYQAPLWQMESVTDPTLQPVYTGLPEAKMLQLEEMSDPVLQPVDVTNSKGKFNKPNFDLSGNLLELTPTLYNFITGLRKPEYESTVVNPYSSSIIRSMAKRRANVQPAIEANRRSRAIANYNAANVNANTGMNLALRSQLAANEYAQNADIYANRDNTNNAYLGEYANTLNNLGQQYVQSSTLANDLNARNRAKARDYASSAASQIGQWAQVKEQTKNQYNRDLMMLPFLSNFLRQGFTKELVDELVNRIKNRA